MRKKKPGIREAKKTIVKSSPLSKVRWLRKLALVKIELRKENFPQSTEEGFRIGIALMAQGLKSIVADIKRRIPNADSQAIMKETKRIFAKFSMLDTRLIQNWQDERKKLIRK